MTNIAVMRKYDLNKRMRIPSEHDYADIPNICHLSEFSKSAISYMAGYAAKMVESGMICRRCCEALGSVKSIPTSKIMKEKHKVGLFKATLCWKASTYRASSKNFMTVCLTQRCTTTKFLH
eukprot:gene7660-8497_t